jgi:hypothetical protein
VQKKGGREVGEGDKGAKEEVLGGGGGERVKSAEEKLSCRKGANLPTLSGRRDEGRRDEGRRVEGRLR